MNHKNYYSQINNQPIQGQNPAQNQPQPSTGTQNPFGGAPKANANPFGGGAPAQRSQAPTQAPPTSQPNVPTTGFAPQAQPSAGYQNPVQNQGQVGAGFQQPNQEPETTQGADPMIDYTIFNADKSLMRTTTDMIPSTYAAFKESCIPFGIVVKPYGELPSGEEVPAVSFKNDPIVRCKDCRAYINPFVRWLENGAKWICPYCGDVNLTESYYYSTIEEDGYRTDHEERPEFNCGTVDFIANHEYMNRPPMPPTFLFALDVSKPAIDSGYLALACNTIKSIIEAELLAGQADERTKVAFLTYDKNVHFYNLKSTLKQPQMMVMTDTEQIFMPQPEDLLVNLQDSYDLVINLLDNLPNYFINAQTQDCAFISALQCSNNIIKTIGGKMIFFQVSSMILRHSKLQPPINKVEEQKKTGVERIDLWHSTNNFFKNTGTELAHGQVSFDLFDFSIGIRKGYKNIKTFADISARSNGNIYYYPEFHSRTHGTKFSNELYHNLSRKTAWEAVFRIRLSQGWTQKESHGNIQIKAKTQDLILAPCMDCDRVFTYTFEKAQDSNTQQTQGRLSRISKRYVFVQTALLYSTSEGQRRIRSHNIAVPLTNSIQEAYEYMDITSVSAFLMRKALTRFERIASIDQSKQIIEASLNNMARACHRASNTPKGQQFEFSENMQYFIMYILGVLKSPIIHFPQVMNPIDTVDKIVYQKFQAMNMSPEEILPLFSPQILLISDANLNGEEFPELQVLSRGSILQDQIYILYNGFAIYFYIGRSCDPYFYNELFKVDEYPMIDKNISEEEIFENMDGSTYLTNLYNLINQIRYSRVPFCEISILLAGEQESESIVQQMCILDENTNPRYRIDFNKFMQRIQGQALQAGAVSATAGGQVAQPAPTGGYY